MPREGLPVWGTVIDGRDVYEVCAGGGDPVTVWETVDGQPRRVGYVEAYELHMARLGHTPQVYVGIARMARMAGRHFRLRAAVGQIIRDPSGQKLDITAVES